MQVLFLPSAKAKILLIHNQNDSTELNAASFNEVAPNGNNQDYPAHHRFNQALVDTLAAIDSGTSVSVIDALPLPPSRCLLKGDMCWQDQGQTNNCGPYSFSSAMNYWYPYTNNPDKKGGAYYADEVESTINGARTPKDITNSAKKFNMHGKDHDGESMGRQRALKLLKLWIHAGVPVLILVKEDYNLTSYHWKCVTGYDGDRIFFNNSGGDHEYDITTWKSGIDYEHAPIGNDIDEMQSHVGKWWAAGGDIVDAVTSVDRCTFIPIYPKTGAYSGTEAR